MDPNLQCSEDISQFEAKSLGSVSSNSLLSVQEGKSTSFRNELYCCVYTWMPTDNDRIISLAKFGDLLYVGYERGKIRIVNMITAASVRIKNFKFPNAPAKALLVAGNKVFSAHTDKRIRIWRRPRGLRMALKLSATLPTVKDHIKNFIKSDNYVQVRRHHKSLWFKHVDAITCLAIRLEDEILYSGSWDKTVKVWKLQDFECIESIKAHDDAVNAMVVGTHGMLFTASADGTVKAWERTAISAKARGRKGPKCRQRHKLIVQLKPGHQVPTSTPVNALALSQDKSALYSGTSDSAINFWATNEESLRMSYKGAIRGHKRSVLCLKSVGKFLCSGSADKTIRVWARKLSAGPGEGHHSCLAVLQGHTGPVKCIAAAAPSADSFSSATYSSASSTAYSPSSSSYQDDCSYQCRDDDDELFNCIGGFILYSGSFDGSVRLWRINTGVISNGQSHCNY